MVSCSTLALDHSCCQCQPCRPLSHCRWVLSTDINRVQRSELVVDNPRPSCRLFTYLEQTECNSRNLLLTIVVHCVAAVHIWNKRSATLGTCCWQSSPIVSPLYGSGTNRLQRSELVVDNRRPLCRRCTDLEQTECNARNLLSTIVVHRIAAVQIWNSLRQHITSAPSLPVFCCRLKTYFFKLCYL